jgi:acetylornithine/N-succinyldiaminopimelate aminotransferase
VAAALEGGLIINAPNDESIRLAPPLIIGDAEIEEFLEKFTAALAAAGTTAAATEAKA